MYNIPTQKFLSIGKEGRCRLDRFPFLRLERGARNEELFLFEEKKMLRHKMSLDQQHQSVVIDETQQSAPKKRGRKAKVEKEPLNLTIFSDCLAYCDPTDSSDEFWRNIFTSYSNGVFPKNISYSQNNKSLKIFHSGKCHSIYLTNDNKNNYVAIKNFMTGVMNITPSNDVLEIQRSKEQEKADIGMASQCSSGWKNIKNRNLRTTLMMLFIEKTLKERHKLSNEEILRAHSFINEMLITKKITHDHIIFDKQQKCSISEISNISFDEKLRHFVLKN